MLVATRIVLRLVGLPPSPPGAPIPLRPRVGECANDGPTPPANPHPLLTEHSATRPKGDICTHSTYLSSPSCPPCSIHAFIYPSPLLISTSSTSTFSPTTTSFRSPRSCRSFSARSPTISIHVAKNAIHRIRCLVCTTVYLWPDTTCHRRTTTACEKPSHHVQRSMQQRLAGYRYTDPQVSSFLPSSVAVRPITIASATVTTRL